MRHFTSDELTRWAADGPGDDRDRVIAHVAECRTCAAHYAVAIRTRPLQAPVEHIADVKPFTDAALRVGKPARVRTIAWVGIPLAAAAAVMLAIFLPRSQSPDRAAPVLRGTTIHALAPAGLVDRVARFDWSSGIVAPRYRVEISGPGGPLGTFDAPASPAELPDEWRQRLHAAVPYAWTVTALDADGRPIATSERRTFTLSR